MSLPNLQYPNIYNYLINFPSYYTRDSLKACKSVEEYRLSRDLWMTFCCAVYNKGIVLSLRG